MKIIKRVLNYGLSRLWVQIVLGVAMVFTLEFFHRGLLDWFVNPALWALANIVLAYFFLALLFYVLLYGFKFKWSRLPGGRPNEAGRLIMAFTSSLLAVSALIIIGVFIDPRDSTWYTYPLGGVEWWRPTARFLIFTGVSIVITFMDITLIKRIRSAQSLQIDVDQKTNPRLRK